MLITVPDEYDADFKWSCDQQNIVAKQKHEAEQAAKPEQERTEFVPVSVQDYATARVTEVAQSYRRQRESIQQDVIKQLAASDVALVNFVHSLTPDKQQQIREFITKLA